MCRCLLTTLANIVASYAPCASLIDRAGNEFGIAGAPVSIDETRIPVSGYPNIWEALRAGETPDLDRYWRVLTQRYEHRGRALAYRQVADAGRSARVGRANAVRRFTTVVRLRLNASSEPSAVRPLRRVAADAHAEVRAALLALAAFAQDAGEPALAGCLRQFDHGEPFAPQQRRTFPGLDVVQYNGYWELRFSFAWRAPPGVRRPAPIRASRVNLGVSSLAFLCPVSTGHFFSGIPMTYWYEPLRAIVSLGSQADKIAHMGELHAAREKHLSQFFTPTRLRGSCGASSRPGAPAGRSRFWTIRSARPG
jgi:hypothetical protein